MISDLELIAIDEVCFTESGKEFLFFFTYYNDKMKNLYGFLQYDHKHVISSFSENMELEDINDGIYMVENAAWQDLPIPLYFHRTIWIKSKMK